jgi:hypothetical protein
LAGGVVLALAAAGEAAKTAAHSASTAIVAIGANARLLSLVIKVSPLT